MVTIKERRVKEKIRLRIKQLANLNKPNHNKAAGISAKRAITISVLLLVLTLSLVTPLAHAAYTVGTVSAGAQSPSSVAPGSSCTYAISSTWSGSSGSGTATLSTTSWSTGASPPTGVTPAFSPTSLTHTTTTSTLTITTTSSTPAGTYTFVVRATEGSTTRNSATTSFVVAFPITAISTTDSSGNARGGYLPTDGIYTEFTDSAGVSEAVNVYVVSTVPTAGQTLTDVRGSPTAISVTTNGQVSSVGTISTLGTYYLVMDGNKDGKYDTTNDLVSSAFSISTLPYITQWGSYGQGSVGISGPMGVAQSPTNSVVFAADSGHNTLDQLSGTSLSFVKAYSGSYNDPTGLAFDGAGILYIADTGNNRILTLSYDSGSGYYTGPSVFLTSANSVSLSGPTAVASNHYYNGLATIYIADAGNNRIIKCTSAGVVSAVFGGSTLYNGVALNDPMGVTVDLAANGSPGNVYIADTGNNRIVELSSTGTYITSWTTYSSGHNLNQPTSISTTYATTEYLWVADSGNHQVDVFPMGGGSGVATSTWALPTGSNPYAIWAGYYNGIDGIFLAEAGANQIQSFSTSGSNIATWGAPSGIGQFYQDTDVAIDPSGNVFVLDALNSRIQEFTSSGTFIRQFGAYGSRRQRKTIQSIRASQLTVAETFG